MTKFILSLTLLFSLTAHARDLTTLKAFFEKAHAKGFSGIVAVAEGERVLWQHGFGLARRHENIPFTEFTLFDLGSVSKQFLGASLVKLEQVGKLSLQDPLSKFLRMPEAARDVTLTQALQHRTGFGYPEQNQWNELSKWIFEPVKFIETFFELAKYDEKRPFFYNNLTYSALSLVVKSAAGVGYEDYFSRELFLPAGMTMTGFNIPGRVNLAFSAIGYEGAVPRAQAGQLPNGIGYAGSTGVISNVADLRKWLLALSRRQILQGETDKLFQTPPGDPIPYGLGWFVDRDADGRIKSYSHGGATIGFVSFAAYYPENETTFLVLMNDSKLVWTHALLQRVFENKIPVEKLDEEIARWAKP